MKKSITDYEAEIRELHSELIDYPDSKTLRNRMRYYLRGTQDKKEV